MATMREIGGAGAVVEVHGVSQRRVGSASAMIEAGGQAQRRIASVGAMVEVTISAPTARPSFRVVMIG